MCDVVIFFWHLLVHSVVNGDRSGGGGGGGAPAGQAPPPGPQELPAGWKGLKHRTDITLCRCV